MSPWVERVNEITEEITEARKTHASHFSIACRRIFVAFTQSSVQIFGSNKALPSSDFVESSFNKRRLFGFIRYWCFGTPITEHLGLQLRLKWLIQLEPLVRLGNLARSGRLATNPRVLQHLHGSHAPPRSPRHESLDKINGRIRNMCCDRRVSKRRRLALPNLLLDLLVSYSAIQIEWMHPR